MAHIVVTYDDIERMYKPTFDGRRITRVKKHPWMPRCLMVEFPDFEPVILLTDEVKLESPFGQLVDEVIDTTLKRRE